MIHKPIVLIFIGFAIGILSGMLGVGGGVFMVPIMVTYLGISQHSAHATSLAVVIPTAIAASLIYGMNSQVNIHIALYLTIGSVTGAILGAQIMKSLPAHQLKRLFGIMLVLVGIKMVWQ